MNENRINLTREQKQHLLAIYEQLKDKQPSEEYLGLTIFDLAQYLTKITGEEDLIKAVSILANLPETNIPDPNMPPDIGALLTDLERREVIARGTREKAVKEVETLKRRVVPTPQPAPTPKRVLPEVEVVEQPQFVEAPISPEQERAEKAKEILGEHSTFVAPPAPPVKEEILSLQKEAQDDREKFISTQAQKIQSQISTIQLPTGLIPEVAARKAAVGLYDAVVNFNPITSLSKIILPKDEVSQNLMARAVSAPAFEYLITPQPGAGEIPATESYIPVSTFIPGPTLLFWAAPEIAKKDPEAGTAAHLAASGYTFIDPTQKEMFRQQAAALGVIFDPERLDFITQIAMRYSFQFGGLAAAAEKAHLSREEFSVLAATPSLNYDQAIMPGQGGFRGLIGNMGQQLFGKVANNLLQKGIEKGLQKLAAGTAAKAVGAEAGAAVGTTVAPIVGTAIGAVVGLVLSAIPAVLKWLKEHTEDLAIGAGAVFAAGIFLGSLPLMALGGASLGGLAASGAGVKTLKSAASGLASLLGIGIGAVFAEIAMPLIISILSFPILVALILFIINSGAYIVPGTGAGFAQAGPSTRGCPGLAANAESIVTSLSPGFWTFLNKSSRYPELFNSSYFASYPNPCISAGNPTGCSGGAPGPNDLFWCTWTPIKAYQEAGFAFPEITGVVLMQDWFKDQKRYLPPDSQATLVSVGSLIFFAGSTGTGHHVGMITEKTTDYVKMVQSNVKKYTTESFTISESGKILKNPGGMDITGFGLPPSECQ